MNRRLTRWLISLYPPRWRRRYGNEFAAFLEERPETLRAIADVVWSAGVQQARACGGFSMNWRVKTLMLSAFGYLMAITIGARLYGADSSAALWIAATGAIVVAVLAGIVVVPVMPSIAAVFRAQPRRVFNQIAVPLGSTVMLSVVMGALFAQKGVSGARLGLTVSALIVSGLIGSATAVVSVRRSA